MTLVDTFPIFIPFPITDLKLELHSAELSPSTLVDSLSIFIPFPTTNLKLELHSAELSPGTHEHGTALNYKLNSHCSTFTKKKST